MWARLTWIMRCRWVGARLPRRAHLTWWIHQSSSSITRMPFRASLSIIMICRLKMPLLRLLQKWKTADGSTITTTTLPQTGIKKSIARVSPPTIRYQSTEVTRKPSSMPASDIIRLMVLSRAAHLTVIVADWISTIRLTTGLRYRQSKCCRLPTRRVSATRAIRNRDLALLPLCQFCSLWTPLHLISLRTVRTILMLRSRQISQIPILCWVRRPVLMLRLLMQKWWEAWQMWRENWNFRLISLCVQSSDLTIWATILVSSGLLWVSMVVRWMVWDSDGIIPIRPWLHQLLLTMQRHLACIMYQHSLDLKPKSVTSSSWPHRLRIMRLTSCLNYQTDSLLTVVVALLMPTWCHGWAA